jgi:GNAT superfamily N-acetyltransferase
MTEFRPLTVDDLSAARYIQTASFVADAKQHYEPADIDAFVAFVRSPRYADLLLGNHAIAAWIGGDMVGTAAWSAAQAPSPTARILGVFVRPLFTGEGIGRQLVEHIEREARGGGYQAFELAATRNSVGFFESLDYRVVRNGLSTLPAGYEMPVVMMRKADAATVIPLAR